HRDGVAAPGGADCGAFQRIEGDVDLGRRAVAAAHLLADVEHGGFVALTFADGHGAADANRVEGLAHGVDGGLIAGLLVAAAHDPGAGESGSFRDANDLECQVAIHRYPPAGRTSWARPAPVTRAPRPEEPAPRWEAAWADARGPRRRGRSRLPPEAPRPR